MKVHFYRFSISWSRILPNGDVSSLNHLGITYYNDVINKLIQNDIQPVVTMYHYDLPNELQKIGGLANPLFVKYFEAYADVLFSLFGDRVKTWITINEPYNFCVPGYGKDYYPPQANAPGIGEYLCVDHTIKAHASVYRLYKSKYFQKQLGKVGITLSTRYFYSKNDDTKIVEKAMQYMLGWIANPIFSQDGGYPEIMVTEIGNNSLREGRNWSRLPVLEGKWKELIKGSSDFLGLNYYTSRFLESKPSTSNITPSIESDTNIKLSVDKKWKRGKSNWIYSVPNGLGDLLRWIRDKYSNVEVIITENGWSDDGQLDDNERIMYLKDHLKEILRAIKNGCNISGYSYWSLIDNFEWREGYTEKFGLYAVNMQSPNRERRPKHSAKIYQTIIKSRELNN